MSTRSTSDDPISIDYIEFSVTDIGDAKRFYGEVFGWTFEDYGPNYVAFESGRIGGGFELVDEVSRGGALVILYAADLEDVLERVREDGGEIIKEIFSFPGGRRFRFVDPVGNELAVWSDPVE